MAVALVTGSSTGIGLATTLDLAGHGYKVYASLRNPDGAAELKAAVADPALDLHLIQLDVTDPAAVSSRGP